MTTFNKEMMAGHNKAAALGSATLSTKENSPDPSDWAAFTLTGLPELNQRVQRPLVRC
jgi:CHAT domain-containing protein